MAFLPHDILLAGAMFLAGWILLTIIVQIGCVWYIFTEEGGPTCGFLTRRFPQAAIVGLEDACHRSLLLKWVTYLAALLILAGAGLLIFTAMR